MLEPVKLIEKIHNSGLDIDVERIEKACTFAINAHGTQKRESGDAYYYHPIEVAEIMVDMRLDTASVITALLHDTIEDTVVTLEDIEREFGAEVAKLVDGVTKLTKIEFQPDHVRQAENFRKLLLAMSEDIRVLLVKLADRVHNMRTLHFVKSPEKRRRIAHETMEIYAPLAERIGIQKIKNELHDIAFGELHPEARNSIVNRLDFLRRQGALLVERIVDHIKKTIAEEGIEAQVSGREKTPCSIWQKMEKKNVSFEQLSDIVAFRILCKTPQDCYRVLGAIHTHYHMVPDGFKDFISTPKGNGYQSLHTVVIGPEKQRIEIQIRTETMHEVAELGVAAHWSYKQRVDGSHTEGRQFRWIRELLNILEHTSEPEDFLEHTKLEMYYDQVFCFTPHGKLIALPKNATPVDFAFALHSDIGFTCVGAKINGRIVPLPTILHNGDQVEIIRSKTQTPSPSWEKFVVTGKARSEIKQFVRSQQRQEYINLGRAILLKITRQEGHELTNTLLEPILDVFRKKTIDDLMASIGEGTISKEEVAQALFPKKVKAPSKLRQKFSFLRFRKKRLLKEDSVPIKGMIPGMAMHFATCCHPLPGDKIIGIVHVGKGVTIHTADCTMLENFAHTPERWIEVSWEKDAALEYQIGRVHVVLSHEIGNLAAVASTIANEGGNISNIKITSRSMDFFEIIFDLEVDGAQHLSNIITSIRSLACVHTAIRQKVE